MDANGHSTVELLRDAARQSPEITAIMLGELSLTYGDMMKAAAGLSVELRNAGAVGRPVLISLPNSMEMAVAIFAIHSAGAQVCAVNPGYTERELTHILSDAEPAVVMFDAEATERFEHLCGSEIVRFPIDLNSSTRTLADWVKSGCERHLEIPHADTIATLQYTGGTTGVPKGVELTHSAIMGNVLQREAVLPTDAGDERVICLMPLFHVFAVSMCLHLSALARGTLVIMPRYRPDILLDLIRTHRITRLPAGPTVFNGLIGFEGIEAADFSSLKSCYSGSAPLSRATLERWEALTGVPIYEGYGQTEAGPVLTYNSPRFPVRVGSVGKPLAGTEIEIVDLETGTCSLEPGELGEIRARGPQIMQGYRGREEATKEALRGSWLYTGDIGWFDRDGYLFIEDRRKDMVITAGYNVYPREIDEVLAAHPDVVEAACVGVPDSYRGEVLKAVVKLQNGCTLGEPDLKAYCSEGLVKYKWPMEIQVWQDLPKTSVGKIDKVAIRQRLREADAHVS